MRYIFIIFMIMLSSCENEPVHLSTKFGDKEANDYFISLLKENNIVYDIKSDGFIVFDTAKGKLVNKLEAITRKEFYPEVGVQYTRKEDTDLMKKGLLNEGIPFRTIMKSGKEFITWERSYNDQALVLREKLSEESQKRILDRLRTTNRIE